MGNRLTRKVDYFVEGLGWISVVALLFVMFLIVADFLRRDILGKPIAGTVEASASCLIFIAFLGMAYAQARGAHIRVDLVTSRLSPRWKSGVNIVVLSLNLAIIALITWKTGVAAWNSFLVGEYTWALTAFPVWPSRLALPVGFGALCLQFIVDLGREITHLRLSPGRLPNHTDDD